MSRRSPSRGLEQFPDLFVTVQVWASPRRPIRKQPGWRHLGSGVMSAPVACKTANETEPLAPFGGTRILVLLRPFHRQRNRNVGRTTLFEKRSELDQTILGVQQLESQTAAQFDVRLNLFTPADHRAPPGQDRANAASDSKSTLA